MLITVCPSSLAVSEIQVFLSEIAFVSISLMTSGLSARA